MARVSFPRTQRMKPTDHNPGDWEASLDRQLKALPDRPAPATLAPRVLALIAARTRLPWYRRPWLTWPRAVQALSLVAVSFVLGALTYASLHFGDLAVPGALEGRLDVWLAPVEALWTAALTLGGLIARLVQQVNPWIWAGLAALAAGMYAACLGIGTVLYRVTIKR